MLKRGVPTAMMGVETWNERAKKLYERLGYKVVGTKQETWKELDKDGKEFDYVADEYQMSKDL
jgi:ribosomal protein S18 acetylase RimI-like enzyme